MKIGKPPATLVPPGHVDTSGVGSVSMSLGVGEGEGSSDGVGIGVGSTLGAKLAVIVALGVSVGLLVEGSDPAGAWVHAATRIAATRKLSRRI